MTSAARAPRPSPQPTGGRNGKPARQRQSAPDALPLDTLTERSVLGMLLDAASEGTHVVKPMIERLRQGCFGDIRHQAIFTAMQAAQADGQAPDLVTVHGVLEKGRQLPAVGGLTYLQEVAQQAIPRQNFDQHARTLAKLESLRLAYDEAQRVLRAVTTTDPTGALAAIVGAAERLRYLHARALDGPGGQFDCPPEPGAVARGRQHCRIAGRTVGVGAK